MPYVFFCLAIEHDLRLVALAGAICILGIWLSLRLFDRGLSDRGLNVFGWNFLAATTAGSAIWSTHFIAILAFKFGAPTSFDPVLTIISLLIVIAASLAGFSVAAAPIAFSTLAGGILLGLGASAMHYSGMNAYHIDGLVTWNQTYVLASVVISVIATTLALALLKPQVKTARIEKAAAMLSFGILGLHFTGMTAMTITPLELRGAPGVHASYLPMALAIALACIVIAGTGLISFIIDHRVRSDSDRKLYQMALYDSLTGLPNRRNFSERLTLTEAEAARSRQGFALIGMDLDRFKEVNDVRGHAAGDTVLAEIGERMRKLESEDLFFARLGGDEFALICNSSDNEIVLELMSNVKHILTQPISLQDGTEVAIGVSLGAAFYPTDASIREELVARADLAMYRAKSSKVTSICFYDASMDEAIRQRKILAAELKSAIANEELELYYQVQSSVETEQPTGFEVLLRWNHPVHGMVSPDKFVPIAEQTGLIMDIGHWVIRTACQQASLWPNDFRIAVNLSPIQLSDPKLPEFLRQALAESGLPPHRLELELTESAFIEKRERTLALVAEIKQLGISIALDDFGTGYSSLETLRSLPFDKIKLDRSFMDQIEVSPQSRAFVRAVLALGKSLQVPVLAEGVETRHQLEILRMEGCDEVQGFLHGRPAPLHEIVAGFMSIDTVTNSNVARLDAVLKKSERMSSSQALRQA